MNGNRLSPEYYADRAIRYAGTTAGMAMMSGLTLVQALANKNLVIVAEICEPFELTATGLFGRLAIKNAREAVHQPIPGCNEPPLVAEPTPDTQTLAQQIGLAG